MTFSRGVVLFIAGVDEALVADEQVAAGKGLGTDVADERLLLGMRADVSLEVLLQAVLAFGLIEDESRQAEVAGLAAEETHKPCKESLAMRTWQGLGFVARLFSLDPSRRCCLCVHCVLLLFEIAGCPWGTRSEGK